MMEPISNERIMIIGTSSNFRAQTLRQHFSHLFQNFITLPPDIDEKEHRASDPYQLTEIIAIAKMKAVLHKLKETFPHISKGVAVTFDQVVVTREGEVREKPISREENKSFLLSYSNKSVKTVAAYAVCDIERNNIIKIEHQDTETFFNAFGEDVVERIINRGVSMNSAGGFVVEDEELKCFVVRVIGTLDGVQGMDPAVVDRLLKQL